MATVAWRLRAGVLIAVGALLVHQVRYALAGLHADSTAHVYLTWLGPLVCGALDRRVRGVRLALDEALAIS